MPPVVALIPVIASVAVAVLKVSALVKALILVGATIAVKLLSKKPSGNRLNQGVELQKRIIPDHPRQVAVGRTATAGSCHFAITRTTDSDAPNDKLYRVLQISDQPINALIAITEGKQTLTFNGDVTTGWRECNQHRSENNNAKMWVRVYKGVFSGAVADATLISETGGRWTSSHKGTGLAYAIVKYDYNPEAFSAGEPELVFVVDGAKCYDDRKDSTVPGGSGTQRLDNPSTWAYTENAAIIAAQYLRGFKINGKRILGVGADARDLLPAMLFSAYNTSDQTVAVSGGGSMKRYTAGMMINANETAEEHLTDLGLAMDGSIFDRAGSITIWPGAVRTPAMNVSAQDIDWTAQKAWQPKPPLASTLNYVSGNFVDAGNYFQAKDLPPLANAAWELEDGGERFSQFISMRAVTNWSQAQRILKRIHQASRHSGVVAFIGGAWLIEMEQGDWFTLTAPRWDMTSKYFEIEDISLTQDMRVSLIAREVTTDLDSWDPASDEFERDDAIWDPPVDSFPIPAITVVPYSFVSTSGVQSYGFTAGPTGGADVFAGNVAILQFEYAPTDSLASTVNAGTLLVDQEALVVTGLSPGTSYSVRARTGDGIIWGIWSDWVEVTTDGDQDTSLAIDGPAESTLFLYDYLGVAEAGELPRDLNFQLVGSSGTVGATLDWEYRVLEGSINSIDAADGFQTMTTGSIGTLVVNTVDSNTNSVEVKVTYGDRVFIKTVSITKQIAAPPTGGGGGGDTGSTIVSKTSGWTGILDTNWVDISGALVGTTPAGITDVDLVANLAFRPLGNDDGSWTIQAKWAREIAGVPTDIGSAVSGTSAVTVDFETGSIRRRSASITLNVNDTGLSASTAYTWRVYARVSVGTSRNHTTTGTGSVIA